MRPDAPIAGWSLRRELTRMLVLTALLPAVVFGIALLWSQWQRDQDDLTLRLASNAQLSANAIDDFLQGQLSGVELMADGAMLSGRPLDEELGKLLRAYPAMLRALAMIAREAEANGIDLRLCGEMAGDSMCVAILIGLGFRHLSMNGRSVARVKYLLRHIDFEEAQQLAKRSLEAQLATEVRHQVAAFMERRGMGGLIRGGR